MRHCYLCDQSLPDAAFRRTVCVGNSNRFTWGRSITTSSTKSQGLRTLCSSCAVSIDTKNSRRRDLVESKVVFGILGFLGLIVIISALAHFASSGRNQNEDWQRVAVEPATAEARGKDPSETPAFLGSPKPLFAESKPPFSWRHTTGSGVRWSLRIVGQSPVLLVELQGADFASIAVFQGFDKLPASEIDIRIDQIRSALDKERIRKDQKLKYTRDNTLTIQ